MEHKFSGRRGKRYAHTFTLLFNDACSTIELYLSLKTDENMMILKLALCKKYVIVRISQN